MKSKLFTKSSTWLGGEPQAGQNRPESKNINYVEGEVGHLCVEGVEIQHVFALELLRVDLLKGDPVGGPVKDVYLGQDHELSTLSSSFVYNLISLLRAASDKVSFPRQSDLASI